MAKAKVHPEASSNIDNYLKEVANNQRPMLELIRKTINTADERLLEDWKWSAPCFSFNGLICWFVAFKNHVGLNFFKGSLIKDTYEVFDEAKEDGKGNRMMKFQTLKEINTAAIQDYVQQAIILNEQNIKVEVKKKAELEMPTYFTDALDKNEAAKSVFEKFTEAQKRDYIEWLVDAKREATRDKRLTQAIEWIAEGKVRNWKYMNC